MQKDGIIISFLLKYKTLIIFLILTAIWSAFFTTIKFFLWWDLRETIAPSLQTIAWYLSLWWVISYLIWWAIAYTFLKKYVLFFVSLFTLIIVIIAYVIWFDNNFFLGFILISIWIFYWLRSVLKNILIAIEIKKTGLPDTAVNALVWIVFVVFIILWTVLWSVLVDKMWREWLLVIVWMLVFTTWISLTLNYDKLTIKTLLKNWVKSYYDNREKKFVDSMNDYLPDIIYITKKYYKVMLVSSLLWAISTVVSQKAVEYSLETFSVDQTKATTIMLYSAVWVIVWNILSARMNKSRWKFFKIFNISFATLIIALPFLWFSFFMVSLIALVIWVFFWIASNLIDAFFFKKIWDENKKEYWASTYWLVLSTVIFVTMFLSVYIWNVLWYEVLMVILWLIVLGISFLNFNEE